MQHNAAPLHCHSDSGEPSKQSIHFPAISSSPSSKVEDEVDKVEMSLQRPGIRQAPSIEPNLPQSFSRLTVSWLFWQSPTTLGREGAAWICRLPTNERYSCHHSGCLTSCISAGPNLARKGIYSEETEAGSLFIAAVLPSTTIPAKSTRTTREQRGENQLETQALSAPSGWCGGHVP